MTRYEMAEQSHCGRDWREISHSVWPRCESCDSVATKLAVQRIVVIAELGHGVKIGRRLCATATGGSGRGDDNCIRAGRRDVFGSVSRDRNLSRQKQPPDLRYRMNLFGGYVANPPLGLGSQCRVACSDLNERELRLIDRRSDFAEEMTVGFIYLANVGDDGGGQAAGGGVVEFADMGNWVLSSYSFLPWSSGEKG